MRTTKVAICIVLGAVGLAAGCRKNAVDKEAFKTALNNYYSSRQDCLWTEPVKLPAQADTSNDDQTKGYDALVDAGLMTRHAAEKQRFLIGSKQVNNYDISDKGRSSWTPDASQPGYGNFCFGHPTVKSIDSYSPPDNSDATQYSVTYRYSVNLPDWANSTESRTAFPRIAAEGDGRTATATLNKSNDGWIVNNVAP